ncbi:uncharacterized protein LOC134814281 isoform X1 [Bolinopsis microptera]|uniref:uncharacterized protein LOC134814281 isoform X1 n=1 Tax=Bolinopsis microptera TaxID=2820187 RepID=UPI00307B06E6
MMLLPILAAYCCQSLVDGTTISALKDMNSEWTTVVSAGHLVEAFSTMGQLHILDPAAAGAEKYYHINLHLYSAVRGVDLEELNIQMDYLEKDGYVRWTLDAGNWKLTINSCEKDFDVDPTASDDDEYHWSILMTDQRFYLKCNGVVVATVVNSESCYHKTGKGKLGIGGWELTNMVNLKTRFENIKNIGSCSMPSYRYNKRGLIGVKKLTTGEDCRYDCQHTSDCKKATVDIAENACKLYSSFGGQARYVNQQETDSQSRYLNYLFGTSISFELDCFEYKDDPCWRNDVRFELGSEETTIKSIKSCLDDEYENEETAMWNPVTGMCSAVHDKYVKIAEIPSPGFSVVYSQCKELKEATDYESCFEYGVILEGNVLLETTYKFPYDCKEECEANEACSGWSSITEIRRCYLYTGAVYRASYPRAVSGTYNCGTDLAPVPAPPGRIVYPVSTNFDLLSITSPGPLNLLINNDDLQRTVHVYQDGVHKFKFDMFSRKQSSGFDFRIEGCPEAFNYTNQPCAYRRRAQNFFQIDYRLLESEISVSLSCDNGPEITDWQDFSKSDSINLTVNMEEVESYYVRLPCYDFISFTLFLYAGDEQNSQITLFNYKDNSIGNIYCNGGERTYFTISEEWECVDDKQYMVVEVEKTNDHVAIKNKGNTLYNKIFGSGDENCIKTTEKVGTQVWDYEGSLSLAFNSTEEATVEEMPNYVFFTSDNLVETCGLSLDKWNGIVFENFDPSDKYGAGLTVDSNE